MIVRGGSASRRQRFVEGDLFADLRARERRQLDPDRPAAPLQLQHPMTQGMAAAQLIGAIGHDQMIVQVCVVLARRARGRVRVDRLDPRYLVAFLTLAGLGAIGVIPGGAAGAVSLVATWMITVALSAVGLSIDVAALRRAGPRPIVLTLWIVVSLLSVAAHAAGVA